MRKKFVIWGVGLLIVSGLIFVYVVERPKITFTPPKPADHNGAGVTYDEDTENESSEGRVVADDEFYGSGPRQHIASTHDILRISIDHPDYEPKKPAVKTKKRSETLVVNNKEYPMRTYTTMLTPNDPSASQWWVTNTKLEQAWDTPVGGTETVLAIIDTGFGLNHEEFANRWYTNTGESGAAASEQPSTLNCTDRSLALNANCNLIDDNGDGVVDNESGSTIYQNPSRLNCTAQGKPLTKDCNRIDDDANGYVDDTQGWDFVNYDNSVQAGELNPSGTGVAHGTMVAGVAAATGNNNKGIAGANWNTKVMPIQAIDDDSYGDTFSVGQSILYAAAQGADVISLSLGSDLSDAYVQEAVQKAIASGSVVVAASGNGGCNCMVYPANYPEVVAVGALNSSSQVASFSSWGPNLDMVAPGTEIYTSTWTSSNPTSAYAANVNGTSFATPLVGGMIARILSQQPNAKPLQLIAAVTESTNRLTIPSTLTQDSKLGYGALDAAKVTTRMATPKNTEVAYSYSPVSKGNILNSSQPSEVSGTYLVQGCDSSTIGTTPVHELVLNDSRFFSISLAEIWNAQQAGYTNSFFAYACLQQPHDTHSSVRSLDLFAEFRNIYKVLR